MELKTLLESIELFTDGQKRHKSKTLVLLGQKTFIALQRRLQNMNLSTAAVIVIGDANSAAEILCKQMATECFIMSSLQAIDGVKDSIGVPNGEFWQV